MLHDVLLTRQIVGTQVGIQGTTTGNGDICRQSELVVHLMKLCQCPDLDCAWSDSVVGWQSALDGLAPHSCHPTNPTQTDSFSVPSLTSISSWRKPNISPTGALATNVHPPYPILLPVLPPPLLKSQLPSPFWTSFPHPSDIPRLGSFTSSFKLPTGTTTPRHFAEAFHSFHG